LLKRRDAESTEETQRLSRGMVLTLVLQPQLFIEPSKSPLVV
jgi:hypothetical protein